MIKIGIDVGGTGIKLGIVENGVNITERDTRPTPHEVHRLSDTLYDMIMTARKKYPNAPCAVSTAGALDEEGNLTANQLGFSKEPLGPLLWKKLGEKIPIENDGICALMAEYRVGALQGCTSAVMITLGTGIGGGIISGGKPHRGLRGGHAEIGHMITHVDGIPCSCGQTGCWECYASASALERMAGGMKPKEVLDGVKEGKYLDIWQPFVHEIAQGMIGLFSLLYPEKIAVGGGLSNAGSIVIDSIKEELKKDKGYLTYYQDIDIVPARFLNDAGILGAAAMIQDE